MPITPLPTPPSRSQSPASFSDDADAFLGALPAFATEANALATAANSDATNAAASAAAADASADAAAASAAAADSSADDAAASAATALAAPGTSATSTTSVAVGTGTKNFTIQTGKAFVATQFVVVANAPGTYMHGQIISYDSGTGALSVSVGQTGGSGTFAAWTVTASAPVIAASGLNITDLDPGTATADQFIRVSSDGLSIIGSAAASGGGGGFMSLVNRPF